jgi:spermidine synthase
VRQAIVFERALPPMPKTSFVKTSQIYLVFTASGATALVYQVIWSRWLGLVFGNTTTSISIVLGSFMLGLALGSWGAGRFLPRISNPLRAYAFMELGIGIFAVCFPYLSQFTDFIFTVTVSVESSTAFSIFARTILAFALLLIPTTFMGATLPVLTDFFRRSPRHTRGWKVGLLYAANTLGAAIGIFSASFLLIELIGVRATTMAAALLNFIIALISFRLASSFSVLPEYKQITPTGRKTDIMGKLAIAVLTAGGGIALASEVLWTRTLETLVGNSTYGFSMIVLLYLVGIAAGSWLMSMIVNRLKHLPLWMASMQLGMGIWIFVALFLFQAFINHISQLKGILVPLHVMFWNYLKVMGVLLPLSLLSGACFPLATRIIDPSGEDAEGVLIAKAYMWNTAGAVVGSLIAGFVIAPILDYFDALYLLALLYCLTAVLAYLIISGSKLPIPRMRTVALSATMVSVAIMGLIIFKIMAGNDFSAQLDARRPSHKVVYHKPGLQGVTTVIKKRGDPLGNILLVNGMGMTIKVTDTKMMAHLPMLLHPKPEDTLVICFGMGTTYRSAVSHGGQVTAVELVEEVLNVFGYFYQDASRVRGYATGQLIVNDGRNFLKLTQQKYDVITIDPPPPIDGAGVNHLYSKEFLQLAKLRLKKGGILAHWIPHPGTLGGVDDEDTFNMLVMTFADVFPYVYVQQGFHNVGLHVIGSTAPLEISTDLLRNRLSHKDVIDDLREWDPVPLDYFQGIRELRLPRISHRLVTDDRPRLEFYLLRTWKNGGKKAFAYSFW